MSSTLGANALSSFKLLSRLVVLKALKPSADETNDFILVLKLDEVHFSTKRLIKHKGRDANWL